jgi:ATP-dependent 26S proteasome regulatory subunit
MDLVKELDLLYRSRHTLICIVSREEERIAHDLQKLCENSNRQLFSWDHGDGFSCLCNCLTTPQKASDPLTALESIAKLSGTAIVWLRDFHQCWKNSPRIIRKLRNLAQEFKYAKITLVVSMPTEELPLELQDESTILHLPLPGVQELGQILDHLAQSPNTSIALSEEQREHFLKSALGLTSNQAQRIFARGIVFHGKLDETDIAMITQFKKEIIRQSGALEFYAPSETIADVGGLETLKNWLRTREHAFSVKAQEYGLPAPKGVALIGIPGTGKSLTAKMISALWNIPLIRLDIGALFGSLVGQSEANVKQALALAEAVAPCLLWIDEIEKGLATGGGDGGTSMRVMGSILSWMQEKKSSVFVVATANNIDMLPPELLRRGRFGDIFFLDLPTLEERREIFTVHIHKRGRKPEDYDLDQLARASDGYVGAEIEQAVIDAMYAAFDDPDSPEREFTTEDIMLALQKLVPMSRSQREIIQTLRNWLTEGRARSASFQKTAEAKEKFAGLHLEPL